MGEGNGREAADILCKERQSLKVLYMSGYPDPIIGQHGIPENVASLPKPFTVASLLGRVRAALVSNSSVGQGG
jgi:hypothetical protein